VSRELPAAEVTRPGDANRTRTSQAGEKGEAQQRRARPARQHGSSNAPARRNTNGDGTAQTSSGQAATAGSGSGAGYGVTGASNTVITAADIARSPASNLTEVLAQTPGVQLFSSYGGIAGPKTMVDLRGFGAFATANTLVLINGRRLNDVDMQQVDFSSIPLDSIERIEITRGNAGAVLYGDNAVGGTINIVTKNGVGGPAMSGRIEAGYGSYNTRLASIGTTSSSGPWSTSFNGNVIRSDGYRTNNRYEQENGTGTLNYTTSDFAAFFNVTGSNQRLGLPGARTVDPSIGVNELVTDRRGTGTPFDYANQQGASATAGFTKTLVNGVDLIVDGGVRDKKQQGGFAYGEPPPSDISSFTDAHLTTWSLTPRLSVKSVLFGMPSSLLTGIDFYDATYRQDASAWQGLDPMHVYNLSQQTLAGYFQHTLGVTSATDVTYGARVQDTRLSARDSFNAAAPFAYGIQTTTLNSDETHYATHLGVEHRLNDTFTLFARASRAFRTPNVDERVGAGPQYDADGNLIPRNFQLKTQTSYDGEGGFRIKAGNFQMQTSVYDMELTNEIHFDPVNYLNYNLDPTRRYGSETAISYRVNDTLTLRGGGAYTRAVFREGAFAGNDVPLVSRYTGNFGLTWKIHQDYLVLDATARVWSARRMDNDQPNTQPEIPASGTIDLKLSGKYDRYFWSLSVNNLLNTQYYDYAVASAYTPDRFNAYPLPGRTYLLKMGATF